MICVDEIILLLRLFGWISGYILNWSKNECLPVNKLTIQIPDHVLPFHISGSGLKYLGINITPAFKELFEKNFTPMTFKLKPVLQRWDVLQITLAGRVNCDR